MTKSVALSPVAECAVVVADDAVVVADDAVVVARIDMVARISLSFIVC